MCYNPFSLQDKTILITGASSGIGRALAIECSKMGARLIITARNQERLSETFSMLFGEGHQQMLVDLADYQQIEKMVEVLPKLDGFVSNAGISMPLVLQLSEKKDVQQVFDVNTFAPIFMSQLLVSNKCLNKGSSMVFISSVSGIKCGYVGGSLYGASKAAVEGFIKATALELSAKNIRVNSVCPGMIETNLLNESSISEEQMEQDKKKYPLKRYGKPEEVAHAAIYLLSDAAKWVTGTSLLIDGGYTIQ